MASIGITTIRMKKPVSRVRKLIRIPPLLSLSAKSPKTESQGPGPINSPKLELPHTARHQPPHGAIAQLGERLDRTQEVGGSSPPSSINEAPATAGVFASVEADTAGGLGKRSHFHPVSCPGSRSSRIRRSRRAQRDCRRYGRATVQGLRQLA